MLWLSAGLLVVTGFGLMVLVASSNTLIHTIVDDSKRGRVMSFFLMAYFGTTPFGSLAAAPMQLANEARPEIGGAALGEPVDLIFRCDPE